MMMDLEEFRRAEKLSYQSLSDLIGVGGRSRARTIAIGESWPDANRLAEIVEWTDGRVTLEALCQRRLRWLETNRGVTVRCKSGESVAKGAERTAA